MRSEGQRGVTLIELVVALALLTLLATAAMPMYEVSVRREREVELRYALRTIREAIDRFHESYCLSGGAAPDCAGTPPGGVMPPGTPPGIPPGGNPPGIPGGGNTANQSGFTAPLIDVSQFDPIDSKGYPPSLQTLVEGVDASGGGGDEDNKVKYLRRVPLDPLQPRDQIDSTDENYGWGVRAYQDDPEATVWGRQNVWDVYTRVGGKALDGTSYNDW